ncbi:cytochrome P450 [Aspergillus clavatus NRRL 1]|uniref:Cytochrome P450, putative n=1 Tax=Aspergillus clavatus (strain ATCC 1007 / CBS 513.65 / DSM 816 / NCTC 3887 / NRRL 1 / QM 1276 / 107) TaxID=344612 RepID=A1CQT2_ASPCL|nr:cytochrome P450, putative [Aspergillus clavatus NRRL 1]EAW08003.1 cytochrome P450, putative [Aspergillus clavatus NRRL 1]
MGDPGVFSSSLLQSLLSNDPRELIWPTLLAIIVFSCLATRIITGFQSWPEKGAGAGLPRLIRTVPYWVPWLGHGISFGWDHVVTHQESRNHMDEAVFAIIMGGTRHNIVVSPSLARAILSSRSTSSVSLINYALEKIGGDKGAIRGLSSSDHHLIHHNNPNLFMREPFLTDASKDATSLIERETPNLVTFCRSMVDQAPWERGSEAEVIDGHDKPISTVNLFALVRNFVGHITTSVFMGQALLEAFPDLLDDIWVFDSHFLALSLGAPRWLPLPGVSAAYAARDRILENLAAFHQAFVSWDDGNEPAVEFRDLEDVSEPVKQRIRKFKELGLSAKSSAPGHLSLLWAMNANSPNAVFWHILRIYSDPALLEEVRKEIAPYVKVSRPSREETGFPFLEPPKISLDSDGLFKSCVLLKASFYETMRLDSASLSFREVTTDLTVTESLEDAAAAGLTQPRTYAIKKGENVSVVHGAVQRDPRFFSNPDQFDPLRFVITDPETGEKRAEMHTISPFGGGVSGCKGRAFAERKILLFSAAIISMWDIEPVEGSEFKIPRHRRSTGQFAPKNDIRVRMSTRV